jgi:hypothetical protein
MPAAFNRFCFAHWIACRADCVACSARPAREDSSPAGAPERSIEMGFWADMRGWFSVKVRHQGAQGEPPDVPPAASISGQLVPKSRRECQWTFGEER